MCRWFPSESSVCLRSVTWGYRLCHRHLNLLLDMMSGDFGDPGLAVARSYLRRGSS